MICISENSACLSKYTGGFQYTASADRAAVLKTESTGRDIDKSIFDSSKLMTLRANPNSSSSIIWADSISDGALDHNAKSVSTDFQSDRPIMVLSSVFR